MAGLLSLQVNQVPVGGGTYTINGGILIIGTSFNGANVYSVAYNSINTIYEHPNQKWVGNNISINGYNVTISLANTYVIIIKTPYN